MKHLLLLAALSAGCGSLDDVRVAKNESWRVCEEIHVNRSCIDHCAIWHRSTGEPMMTCDPRLTPEEIHYADQVCREISAGLACPMTKDQCVSFLAANASDLPQIAEHSRVVIGAMVYRAMCGK